MFQSLETTNHKQVGSTRLDLAMPKGLSDGTIGVDYDYLRFLQKLAGIRTLTARSVYGKRSIGIPGIAGSTRNSTFATRAVTSENVDTIETSGSVPLGQRDLLHNARSTDVNIKINMLELSDRADAIGNNPINAYASEFDLALRRGIMRAGYTHLTQGYDSVDMAYTGASGAIAVIASSAVGLLESVHMSTFETAFASFLLTQIGIQGLNFLELGNYMVKDMLPKSTKETNDGLRFSLFGNGPQIDRILLLKAATDLGTAVAPTHSL